MDNFLTSLLYYWWIPCVCTIYVLYGWLTKQNNVQQTTQLWFWALSICGAFPLWSFVSRTSKNLLVDGFMYDLCMLLAYVDTLIVLGEAEKFVLNQWIGFILCVAGILLMKVRIGI